MGKERILRGMSFYIEKIDCYSLALGKRFNHWRLSNGVNIIYGPSKIPVKPIIVKCIDYMFGSDKEPVDISTGYEVIEDYYCRTEHGKLIMSDKIGENK